MHENSKQAFSNSCGLKSVFEKPRFRDGLVWTGGLTALPIFPGVVWMLPEVQYVVQEECFYYIFKE